MRRKLYIQAICLLVAFCCMGCVSDNDKDYRGKRYKLNIHIVDSKGGNLLVGLEGRPENYPQPSSIVGDTLQICIEKSNPYSGELPQGCCGVENLNTVIIGQPEVNPYWVYDVYFHGFLPYIKNLPKNLETKIKSEHVFGDNEWHVLRTEWKWEGFRAWDFDDMKCTAAYFDDEPLDVSKFKPMSHEPQTATIIVD